MDFNKSLVIPGTVNKFRFITDSQPAKGITYLITAFGDNYKFDIAG